MLFYAFIAALLAIIAFYFVDRLVPLGRFGRITLNIAAGLWLVVAILVLLATEYQ